MVMAGANVHDTKLLDMTLNGIVVECPDARTWHLSLDKGYDNPTGREAVAGHGCQRHIRRIGEDKLDANEVKLPPARQWVLERTLAWLPKCRAIPLRYNKKASNHIGLIQLACPLFWYQRQRRLGF